MLPVTLPTGGTKGKDWSLASEDRASWVRQQGEDPTIIRMLAGELKMGRFKLLVETDGLVRLLKKGSRPDSSKRTVTIVPVPRRIFIIRHFHDHSLGGHLGISRKTIRIQDHSWWPLFTMDVTNYVLQCPVYRKSKVQRTVTWPLRMGWDLLPIPGFAIAFDLVSFKSIPSKEG